MVVLEAVATVSVVGLEELPTLLASPGYVATMLALPAPVVETLTPQVPETNVQVAPMVREVVAVPEAWANETVVVGL